MFKNSKRHILKTLTWRFVATIDTILISWFLTGDWTTGIKIGFFEVITKMFLYYFHERIWIKSSIRNPNKRHIYKTITWRSIGTLDTIFISWFLIGELSIGLSIGGIELISKTILYYVHEKMWYSMNYGLQLSNNKRNLKN